MRKLLFVLVVAAIAVVSSSSASVHTHDCTSTPSELVMTGAHCNGTVGCDCKGFAPITNGDEWEKAYCKHCGHKKSVHH